MTYKPPMTGPSGAPLVRPATNFRSTGDDAAGETILHQNAGNINRFVAKQRLNYDIGNVAIQNARMSVDGLDVSYTNQFGRETLTYTAHPVSTQPQPVEVVEEIPQPEFLTYENPELIAVLFFDGAT